MTHKKSLNLSLRSAKDADCWFVGNCSKSLLKNCSAEPFPEATWSVSCSVDRLVGQEQGARFNPFNTILGKCEEKSAGYLLSLQRGDIPAEDLPSMAGCQSEGERQHQSRACRRISANPILLLQVAPDHQAGFAAVLFPRLGLQGVNPPCGDDLYVGVRLQVLLRGPWPHNLCRMEVDLIAPLFCPCLQHLELALRLGLVVVQLL